MNRILENEIYRLIKRFPTETELKSLQDYLDKFVDSETMAESLSCLVGDWFDDYMTQCLCCGEYHLITEMEEYCGDYYCDECCLYTAQKEGINLHEEARAEYVTSNR